MGPRASWATGDDEMGFDVVFPDERLCTNGRVEMAGTSARQIASAEEQFCGWTGRGLRKHTEPEKN